MKTLIRFSAFAVVFCCLHAKTVSAKELYKCSDSRYSEISCAGQQSWGWGCKAGSEACSPSKSGDCSCGALRGNPGTGAKGAPGSVGGAKVKPATASGANKAPKGCTSHGAGSHVCLDHCAGISGHYVNGAWADGNCAAKYDRAGGKAK